MWAVIQLAPCIARGPIACGAAGSKPACRLVWPDSYSYISPSLQLSLFFSSILRRSIVRKKWNKAKGMAFSQSSKTHFAMFVLFASSNSSKSMLFNVSKSNWCFSSSTSGLTDNWNFMAPLDFMAWVIVRSGSSIRQVKPLLGEQIQTKIGRRACTQCISLTACVKFCSATLKLELTPVGICKAWSWSSREQEWDF